jgi:serine/threonine-protein phosphatase PGAM5
MRPDLDPAWAEKEIDDNHNRIEAAFHKYIHRADSPDDMMSLLNARDHQHHKVDSGNRRDASSSLQDEEDQQQLPTPLPATQKHEFEVIVGHGNVIRYFTCRALQIPPEAWLRLSCFNCSITYLIIHPNGYVTCRAFGDMGHLGYDNCTFSGKHGYHWA